MNRKKRIYLLLAMLGCFMFPLIGCIKDSDESVAQKKLGQLVSAIEEKDAERLRSLFAKSKINDISTFEQTATDLFAYLDEPIVSVSKHGPGVNASKTGGNTFKYFQMSNVISTSNKTFRIAVYICEIDTANSENVGIWSLYIINKEHDIKTDYFYWGDNLWTPGINVGIPGVYPED
ncbi:MAG: DUF5104 domain-containing protein [Clostridiales bacterium]|jgi:hypothetical protein|nr:DUF5104 domain-containing protein [Clostridiales bacterium]